jgi:Protein of unknown function (DUF3365)
MTFPIKTWLALFTIVGLLTAGCQPSAKDSPSSASNSMDAIVTIVKESTPSEAEKSKLLAAKEVLFTKLSGRLMDALSKGGPAGAIGVCQTEAKSIAIDVGKQSNVKIGRKGVRLRNTSNVSPPWAKDLVAAKTDSPVFVKLSNGHAAALLPIKLQPQCLMCHGPSDSLHPNVKDKLAKLYPQDQATGFSEGELRGWFWVEALD